MVVASTTEPASAGSPLPPPNWNSSPTAQDQVARKITCFNSKTEEVPLHIDGSPSQVAPGMFVGSYFLVGGGSLGARTVAISRQTASAAFDVTSGL
jgi:hypothetical protein